jgi:hypothetical protein
MANGKTIEAWGMGGYANIGTGLYALFVNDVTKKRMEARIVHSNYPNRLSEPISIYEFKDFSQGTVFLDMATNSWYMFYRTRKQDKYHVKLAPVRKMRD